VSFHHSLVLALILLISQGVRPTSAQPGEPHVRLVVEAGRPLRLALDRRTVIQHVGQQVTGTLLDPVYSYDRIVLPAGTKAVGRVESLESASKGVRARAMLAGDFSPQRRVRVQFDALISSDGREISIRTAATEGAEHVVLKVAEGASKPRIADRAREEIARQAKAEVSVVTAPGKRERLHDAAIRALPYHRQFLGRGTVFTAKLLSPLDFGTVIPLERAPDGATPVPDSVLDARLVTSIGSATSARGMPIEAVLTRPVLSADQRLILPEGTRLTGEVTFVKRAGWFHRHGRLRFLFEKVQSPDQTPDTLLASLYAVQSRQTDDVTVDEEGGTTSTSSKVRFAAPALATLALVGTFHGRLDYDTDGAGPETEYGGVGSSTVGGFLAAGVFGIAINQFGRPVTIATTVIGLGRTVYSTVFAKGREISFPADTAIRLQLGAGATPAKRR
jgi:hypothetical protein